MLKKSITATEVVELLNEALCLEPDGINKLMRTRTTASEELADHISIQVIAPIGSKSQKYKVGFLGLLNGMFGVDPSGRGPIFMMLDTKTGRIIKFGTFEKTKPKKKKEKKSK